MNAEDAYYVDAPSLRSFIGEVTKIVDEEEDLAERVRRLRAPFGRLLSDQQWLPESFAQPDEAGGMGGGIGNYLLYRSADHSLTLMSLVLPGGASTPVHDHLAWGLVGVYAGEQHERVYRRVDRQAADGLADLIEEEQRHLKPGDFYDLLPPEGDIHAVRATGDVPSVSLHLLGSDIGCVWRHRYEPERHLVHPFRSSYSNVPCPDEENLTR
jgi:predicted metal-dependent enzyme (double-stranded beta helix superfamily)